MDFINKMFRGDRVIWIIFVSLCLISIVEVYSASSTLTFHTDYWAPIMRHTSFILAGVLIVLGVHAIKPKYFAILGIIIPLAWILLVATRIFGTPINGSYRWIEILGIQFQPSEIAKLSLITLTALFLSKRSDDAIDNSFKWITITTAITCGIIVIDNGSTAIFLAVVVFLMMCVGNLPVFRETGKIIWSILKGFLFCILYFIPNEKVEKRFPSIIEWKKRFQKGLAAFLLFTALIAVIFSVIHFMPDDTALISDSKMETWKNRIERFFSEVDVLKKNDKGEYTYKITDDNFQSAHGCIAIANGGVFGKMPGNGQERNSLPQAYSDFIYAIIIEETGLIGGIVVLFLYLILFIRSGIIANRCDKLFPKILVLGITMLFVVQALSNMAVAVHLIPVTGQPLPLISRGGTSTLINCIYIGIILSVSRYENPTGAKREEEIVQELEEEQNNENVQHNEMENNY